MKTQKDFGKYEDSNPTLLHLFGLPTLVFDDALSVMSEEGLHREREMILDGKRFQIRSFFPSEPSADTTEKLLRLIDNSHTEKKK